MRKKGNTRFNNMRFILKLLNIYQLFLFDTFCLIFLDLFDTIYPLFSFVLLLFFFNVSWRYRWSKASNHGYPRSECIQQRTSDYVCREQRREGDNSIIKGVGSFAYWRKYTALSCLSEFQAQDDGRNTL